MSAQSSAYNIILLRAAPGEKSAKLRLLIFIDCSTLRCDHNHIHSRWMRPLLPKESNNSFMIAFVKSRGSILSASRKNSSSTKSIQKILLATKITVHILSTWKGNASIANVKQYNYAVVIAERSSARSSVVRLKRDHQGRLKATIIRAWNVIPGVINFNDVPADITFCIRERDAILIPSVFVKLLIVIDRSYSRSVRTRLGYFARSICAKRTRLKNELNRD